MEKDILTVQRVCKSFNNVPVLDNVSFSVKSGEIFFLLGPSGCGKTTLLRIISGLCEPDAGKIIVAGHDVTGRPAYERKIGLVFQNYALWPHLTVEQNVAYGLQVRRMPEEIVRERIAKILRTMGLSDERKKFPGQLSGGQQQRTAIARALVVGPRILLLDEPLSNLDALLKEQMREEIRRLHRESGVTLIYVTHDQKEAMSLGNRIAVIANGTVAQAGPPPELYFTPASRFVAGFTGALNTLAGTVTSEAPPFVSAETPEGTFRLPGRGLKLHDRISVCFRPESAAPGEEHTNTARGEITAVEFGEGIVRIAVKTARKDTLTVIVSPDEGRNVRVGAPFNFTVPPEKILVFPGEPS